MTTVTELIDTLYKDFSYYTLEQRAIPSGIDGLKTVQRKLLYAMLQQPKGQKVKVAELGGSLAKYGYVHGEASAQQAAVGMAQEWDNNAALFVGHGNFGSRLIPEAAAPRYIYSSLSQNYGRWFADDNLLVSRTVDDPEPQYYYPIIPWVLVNGVEGIAVGFSTKILPRDPIKLAKAVGLILSGKMDDKTLEPLLVPSFPGFTGTVTPGDKPGKWIIAGTASVSRNTITVTELPFGVDRESYTETLFKMIDKGEIEDAEDGCSEDGFGFTIKVTRQQLAAANKVGLESYLNLVRPVTENITVLDENGKVKLVTSPVDLVKWFVEQRLSIAANSIADQIARKKETNKELSARLQFISHVVEGTTEPWKMRTEDLKAFLSGIDPIYGPPLSSMSVGKFTVDETNILKNKIDEIQLQIDTLSVMSPRTYLTDLLKKAIQWKS